MGEPLQPHKRLAGPRDQPRTSAWTQLDSTGALEGHCFLQLVNGCHLCYTIYICAGVWRQYMDIHIDYGLTLIHHIFPSSNYRWITQSGHSLTDCVNGSDVLLEHAVLLLALPGRPTHLLHLLIDH